jgi:hypothetical protein
MGSLTQQFFSSSDVIATTCFGHTTIIKWYTVVYCLKLFAVVVVTVVIITTVTTISDYHCNHNL